MSLHQLFKCGITSLHLNEHSQIYEQNKTAAQKSSNTRTQQPKQQIDYSLNSLCDLMTPPDHNLW